MLLTNKQKDKAIKKLFNNAIHDAVNTMVLTNSLGVQITKQNNLKNKKAFLTRKTFLDQKNIYEDLPDLKNIIIQDENLIHFYNEGNFSDIEHELKTFKVLNKHIYDLIKYYCDMTNNPIQKVVYQVRQKKNQILIKNIIIANVLNLNKKHQNLMNEKQIIREEELKIEEELLQPKKQYSTDLRMLLIELLNEAILEDRADINNPNVAFFFLGYIDQILPIFESKNATISLIKNKLISCTNHQMNKLTQKQIQSFIQKIINQPNIHIG